MDEAESEESTTLDAVAADAPGVAVTPDALSTPLAGEDADETETETLASLLDDGENPLYLLTGAMVDRVLDDGSRRRRVAARNRVVWTLVTDRAVHFVVQYDDRFAHDCFPLERVRGAAVDAVGTERRLRVQTTGDDFAIYPREATGADLDGVVSYLEASGAERAGSQASDSGRKDTDDDTVSALERLAALHERGHLTDEEFRRAKDELL